MTRLDRLFAAYRTRALASPITRANQKIVPELELPGGVTLALSVNK